MLLNHRAVGRAQLGASRVEVGAGGKPAEQLGHAMHAAVDHRRVEMVRAGHDVGDDFGLGGIGHRRFDDADDGGGAIAEPDGLADHRRIALERRGPEAIREHRGTRRLRPVVGRVEQAAFTGRRPMTSK